MLGVKSRSVADRGVDNFPKMRGTASTEIFFLSA
jgi:hypothetical protein